MKKMPGIILLVFAANIGASASANCLSPTAAPSVVIVTQNVAPSTVVVMPQKIVARKKTRRQHMVSSTIVNVTVVNKINPTAKDVLAPPISISACTQAPAKKYRSNHAARFIIKVFSPDPTSMTARDDHFSLIAGIQAFNGVDTSSQPTGFETASSDQTGISPMFGMSGRIGIVGLEYRPFPHIAEIGTQYYGSSLGSMQVNTSNVLVPKLYLQWHNLSASIGLGIEYAQITGTLERGGIPYQTSGGGWSPLLQIEGNYYLNRHWWLTVGYEKTNIRLDTPIKDTPDLVTNIDDQFTTKINLGFF